MIAELGIETLPWKSRQNKALSFGWSKKRIPDPTNGQSLFFLDFLGLSIKVSIVHHIRYVYISKIMWQCHYCKIIYSLYCCGMLFWCVSMRKSSQKKTPSQAILTISEHNTVWCKEILLKIQVVICWGCSPSVVTRRLAPRLEDQNKPKNTPQEITEINHTLSHFHSKQLNCQQNPAKWTPTKALHGG